MSGVLSILLLLETSRNVCRKLCRSSKKVGTKLVPSRIRSFNSGSILGMGSGIVVVTVAGIVTGDALVSYWADLATERERHLTTGKRAERTKLDFRCPICHYAFCKASCLNSTRRRQLTFRSVAKGA